MGQSSAKEATAVTPEAVEAIFLKAGNMRALKPGTIANIDRRDTVCARGREQRVLQVGNE